MSKHALVGPALLRLSLLALGGVATAAGCSGGSNASAPTASATDDAGETTEDDEANDAGRGNDAGKTRDGGAKDAGKTSSDDDAAAADDTGVPPSGGSVNVPDGVGFVLVDYGNGTFPQCVGTLISPTRIVSRHTCFATRPFGGSVANNYFALAKDLGTPSKWIAVTKSSEYKFVALMELAQPLTGVTPVTLAGGPLTAADVGKSFVTVHAVGRDIDGTLPPGTIEHLEGSTTVLRAVTGQPMKTLYPTFASFVQAYTDVPFERSDYLSAGELDTYGNAAPRWQRPLLGKYDMFANGPNEAAIDGNDLSSQGAPLLRAKGAGYEIVGLMREAISAGSKTVKPYVMGAYYAALPADTLAMLNGNGASGDNCGDIQEDKGVCRNGFALNCGVFGGTEIPFSSSATLFCGAASACSVHPFATDATKFYSQCQ